MLIHSVFLSLKDPQPANIEHLLAECRKYLTDHSGMTYFWCGTLADLNRPVNDRLFDVGLHMIFADRAAHDRYLVHERHVKFRELYQPSWRQFRVFDTDVGA